MNQFPVESGIILKFGKGVVFEELDKGRAKGATGLKLVDFVFKHKGKNIFLEVKALPSEKPADDSSKERHKFFLESVKNATLAHNSLVPKCRGSYLFLHLMEEINEDPIGYVILLEPFDSADLLRIRDRVALLLKKETQVEWKKRYAILLGVFNKRTLNYFLSETLTVA